MPNSQENWKKNDQNKHDDVKEDFCGACLTIPLAFAGVGASAYGGSKGSHKKAKKYALWGGIITIIISLLIAIYYLVACKTCR